MLGGDDLSGGITAAGILMVLLAAWLAHRLTIGRDRERYREEARIKLLTSFSGARTAIDGKQDAHFVLTKYGTQHDAALLEFRRFVPKRKRSQYASACVRYRETRERLNPAILEFYRSQATGTPIDSRAVEDLVRSIDDVLKFADVT